MMLDFTRAIKLFSARLSLLILLMLAGIVFGTASSFAQEELVVRQAKSQENLEQLRQEITINAQQEAALAEEISSLNADRAALNKRLIKITANSRALEQKIERTSERIVKLEADRVVLNLSLRARRALLSEVLAALQRMGRNPPPALLISPQDVLVSVRSAILLGSVVPEIRLETELLADELSQLAELSAEISVRRGQLDRDLKTEATEERRLSLLIQEKKKRSKRTREKQAAQGIEAARLAARATSLTNLIARLETEIETVNLAATAARRADDERLQRQNEQIATAREEALAPDFSDTSRINPAVEFTSAKGFLLRPVNGVQVRNFGDKDELGEPSPGMAIATRINARVISPADGWVVYSGPFRSYGQLLILNVGSKHYIVMSGMEKIDVELGQFVLAGEPIGIMGSRRIASAGAIDIDLAGNSDAGSAGLSRPILAIEFRNDSVPIDPAPWWQANTEKRANDDS